MFIIDSTPEVPKHIYMPYIAEQKRVEKGVTADELKKAGFEYDVKYCFWFKSEGRK